MNKPSLVIRLLLILGLVSTSPSFAGDVSPAPWQKQSLKGITSLRYGVAEGCTYDAIDDLAASLSGIKLSLTRIPSLKEDFAKPLSTTEARLILVATDREDDQCWVGLTVDQRCQLKRTPSINLDSQTYKLGRMCPRSQVQATVKSMCAQFIQDLSAKLQK